MGKKRVNRYGKFNNKLNFRDQLSESLIYLKESKNYIYFSVLIFVISGVFGIVYSDKLVYLDTLLKEIVSKTTDLNTGELIFFIMQNNMQSALIAVAGGIFLGIMPIFNAVTNGVIIGYVISKTYEVAGSAVLLRLIPHGIFELPAIFISLGLGIKLGFSIFSNKDKGDEFLRRFYNSANVFLMVVIPLLIVAAIIEGFLIDLVG